ncbi:hypothetical protein [Shewanella sp. UCD-KL21]|uniref:hypothetical protein n=1 Tax=Shewanella sp. UCD-KL21 TaxID=1917164 RepID=UPI0011157CBF|nr:hypothetical protein [Shewanella sp. UCD-KL21]
MSNKDWSFITLDSHIDITSVTMGGGEELISMYEGVEYRDAYVSDESVMTISFSGGASIDVDVTDIAPANHYRYRLTLDSDGGFVIDRDWVTNPDREIGGDGIWTPVPCEGDGCGEIPEPCPEGDDGCEPPKQEVNCGELPAYECEDYISRYSGAELETVLAAEDVTGSIASQDFAVGEYIDTVALEALGRDYRVNMQIATENSTPVTAWFLGATSAANCDAERNYGGDFKVSGSGAFARWNVPTPTQFIIEIREDSSWELYGLQDGTKMDHSAINGVTKDKLVQRGLHAIYAASGAADEAIKSTYGNGAEITWPPMIIS